MGASVSGYWPGITDEQPHSLTGFDNDCSAWGNWMAERYNHPDVLATMKQLGVGRCFPISWTAFPRTTSIGCRQTT